jgi:hypothetical protein
MDYAEALTIIDSCLSRLKNTLPQGRWVESLELTILVEQHCRALAEECKRQQRLTEPADHAPRRQVYAHFHYPDEA